MNWEWKNWFLEKRKKTILAEKGKTKQIENYFFIRIKQDKCYVQ